MTANQKAQKLITWNESQRVGVASIDGENQRLVKLINRLYQHMLTGDAQQILPQVLYHLEAGLGRHFANEEAVLEGHAYPEIDDQRYQHRQFRIQVQEWQRDYREGKPVTAADVLVFLQGWWRNHVLGVDYAYIGFMQSHGVAEEIWCGNWN